MKLKVKAILFDLDDTLVDYSKARLEAKELIGFHLEKNDIDRTIYWQLYNEIEPLLFREFLNNSLIKESYRVGRFKIPLDNLSISGSLELAKLFNLIYLNHANQNIELFKDVMPTIQQLRREGLPIAILTNGPSDGQRNKINQNKLTQYFEHLFISEEIGYSKPTNACFKYVEDQLKIPKQSILMVGDSLKDDYLGASSFGMPAILLDRQQDNQVSKEILSIQTLVTLNSMIEK